MLGMAPGKALKGKNKYCGPAALAAIIDCDTDTAAALIRQESGQRRITGTWDSAMYAVIRRLGGALESRRGLCGKPVWAVAKGSPLSLLTVSTTSSTFTGHYVVVRRGKVLDSFSRKWEPANQHKWRNAKIQVGVAVTRQPKLPKPRKHTPPSTRELLEASQRSAIARIGHFADFARRWLDNDLSFDYSVDEFLNALEGHREDLVKLNVTPIAYGRQIAQHKREAEARRKAWRANVRRWRKEALLVVKVSQGILDELMMTEEGRHEESLNETGKGIPYADAYNRSPDGELIFLSKAEIEDTIYGIETGTIFIDEPARCEAAYRFAQRLKGHLARL